MKEESVKVEISGIDFELLASKDKIYSSIIKSDSVAYITRLTRVISKMDSLSKIIESMLIPDYISIYNAGNEKDLIEIDRLRQLISQSTGSTKYDYIKDLSEYEPNDLEKFAILIDVMLQNIDELNLGLGISNSFPYFFNGYYWEPLLVEFIKEILALVAQNSGFKYYFIKTHKRLDDLYKQFSASSYIPENKKEKGVFKINLKNGRLTIKDGIPIYEKVFESKDFFKYQLECSYDPTAKYPRFQAYLDRALPEKEVQKVLSEYIGYLFTDLKLEKCLVLAGIAHSGKSVFHDIINLLLGQENVSSYSLNNLCNDNGYYRAQLANLLLNYCSEFGGKGCNSDTVKQLVSGEPISCRSPYGTPFILRDYCKLIFNTNLIPQDTEKTNAYYRRFIFVMFDQVISQDERNVNLAKEIFSEESSGILNWVLDGLNRIVKNKAFTKSDHIDNAMAEIKREHNSVAMFMEESYYKPSKTNHQEKKDLFKEYIFFCQEGNQHPVSQVEFARRLRELGYTIETGKTNNQTWIYCDRIDDTEELIKKTFDTPESPSVFNLFNQKK